MSVVLPASGCEMMANVRLDAISSAMLGMWMIPSYAFDRGYCTGKMMERRGGHHFPTKAAAAKTGKMGTGTIFPNARLPETGAPIGCWVMYSEISKFGTKFRSLSATGEIPVEKTPVESCGVIDGYFPYGERRPEFRPERIR